MKKFFLSITNIYAPALRFHITLLIFRVAIAVQLMLAHGLKKIGVGVANAEIVPNPLHLPNFLNQLFAEAANLVFPVFVIAGLFTRLAVLPVLAVTLTGFFIVHFHDSFLEKDVPFMYSAAYLLLLSFGPGRYSIDYYINQKLRR
jgi:putative oxidoreductase